MHNSKATPRCRTYKKQKDPARVNALFGLSTSSGCRHVCTSLNACRYTCLYCNDGWNDFMDIVRDKAGGIISFNETCRRALRPRWSIHCCFGRHAGDSPYVCICLLIEEEIFEQTPCLGSWRVMWSLRNFFISSRRKLVVVLLSPFLVDGLGDMKLPDNCVQVCYRLINRLG